MRRLSSQVRVANKDTADGNMGEKSDGGAEESGISEFDRYLDPFHLRLHPALFRFFKESP